MLSILGTEENHLVLGPDYTVDASDNLINTLNEAYSSDRLSPMSTFIMDVGSPFFKFSTPFPYTTITQFSPYTLLILRWISAALRPSACKKRITLRNSHLAGASIVTAIFMCPYLGYD